MLKKIMVAIVGGLLMASPVMAAESPKDKKSCMMMLAGLDPILDSKKIPKEMAKIFFGQLEGVSAKCQSGKFSEAVSSIESLKTVLGKLEDK